MTALVAGLEWPPAFASRVHLSTLASVARAESEHAADECLRKELLNPGERNDDI